MTLKPIPTLFSPLPHKFPSPSLLSPGRCVAIRSCIGSRVVSYRVWCLLRKRGKYTHYYLQALHTVTTHSQQLTGRHEAGHQFNTLSME